jgi:glycosyltransferase 2 family protein
MLRRLAGSVWIRALVSAGLLALVSSQIDFGKVSGKLSTGRWDIFALAVACVFVSFLVAGVRWQVFLTAAGVERHTRETVRAYLIGAFTNNFLPSQFGGDATRAWIIGAPGNRIRAVATVLVDRLTALVCLVFAAWLAYLVNPRPVPASLVAALGVASAGLTAGVLLAWVVLGGAVRSGRRIGGIARETLVASAACLGRVRVISRGLVLGCIFQALVLLAVWLCARAISLGAPFSVLAVSVPTVLILSALPLSIGGFGVREGSFVLLLGRAGISSSDATVLSLLTAAAFALASLPGAAMLLRPGSPRPAQPQDREQERGEEDLDAGHETCRRDERDLALPERARTTGEPVADDDRAAHDPGDYEGATHE